jgi:ABC-type nitrate/sulfonate/bicarbonate transport system permease component
VTAIPTRAEPAPAGGEPTAPGRRSRRRLGRLAVQAIVPVGLVVTWWWTSRGSTSYLYPPLGEVLGSLRDDWIPGRVRSDLLPSLGRFAAGYLVAAVAGMAAGTAIGLLPWLRRGTLPLTEFVRSIPSPLLFPFALVVFGIGDDSKVALIAVGSVWPVLLNTVDGVRGIDPEILDVARAFRMRWRMRITRIVLPAASPKIVAGLRIALSVALLLMVVSEMRGGTNGLGFQVRYAERTFDTADAYAGVILIGAVGLVVNLLFIAAEGRLMRWHRGARGMLEETGSSIR